MCTRILQFETYEIMLSIFLFRNIIKIFFTLNISMLNISVVSYLCGSVLWMSSTVLLQPFPFVSPSGTFDAAWCRVILTSVTFFSLTRITSLTMQWATQKSQAPRFWTKWSGAICYQDNVSVNVNPQGKWGERPAFNVFFFHQQQYVSRSAKFKWQYVTDSLIYLKALVIRNGGSLNWCFLYLASRSEIWKQRWARVKVKYPTARQINSPVA